MTSAYRLQGKTLADVLNELYAHHGIIHNYNESIKFDGADVESRIESIMNGLRLSSPQNIGKSKVVYTTDYLAGIRVESGGNRVPTMFPAVDMLEFCLDNGCSIIIRPSGTEAKLKIYYSILGLSEQEIEDLLSQNPKQAGVTTTSCLRDYYHDFIRAMILQPEK